MGMFAVKNDKGEWLGWEVYQDDPEFICGGGSVWTDLDKAKFYAKANGGHVVELVEAPVKVVVSEDEAKMLKKAKDTTVWRPAAVAVISDYVYNTAKDSDQEELLEDRLMRAYVIGWTVEKPKRYVLPMEGTKLADGTIAYATVDHTGVWTIKGYSEKKSAVAFHATVTQSDIDAAPAWVKAITPVEVTDDEQ